MLTFEVAVDDINDSSAGRARFHSFILSCSWSMRVIVSTADKVSNPRLWPYKVAMICQSSLYSVLKTVRIE